MRIRNVLYGLALAAALGGCANQAGNQGANQAGSPGGNLAGINAAAKAPAGQPVWTEPPRYTFTLTSSCGERALIGRFQVTVSQGFVTRQLGLDDSARRALTLRLGKLVPTLGELKAEADTAREKGADQVVVEADPSDGHPTSIRIDPRANAIDDESCYEISDYSVG